MVLGAIYPYTVLPIYHLDVTWFTGFLHLGCNLGVGKRAAVSCVALTVPWSKRVLIMTVSRRSILAPILNPSA